MTRIGNSIFFIGSLLLFSLTLPGRAFAQESSVEATVSENKIFIGEQFTLSVEVRGSAMRDVSLPVLPQIDGVGVVSSNPSRSTSISIVNGRTTTSTTYTFSLIARQQGVHTIPPVSIDIDGETHTSRPIQIEIIERGNLSSERGTALPDIFLEVQVDEESPVTGQQIVASVVLFFKQGIEITSFQPTAGWRTDGFWKEELENIRQPEAESVILNGVRYRTATLLRYALFPSRSGTLTLSEYPMSVGVRTRAARNDPFGSFFGGTNQRRVSIESEAVELNVTPLPVTQNALMINAVGDLSVERQLNRRQVETGETIELTTTIRGTGNIPLVRRPEYPLPEGLDKYTPQESSNVERRGLNIRGEKSYTELLVPRSPGQYTIPEQQIAIFDASLNRYRYTTLPELQFEALPGARVALAADGPGTGQIPQPVTGLAVWHTGQPAPFHQQSLFWILLLLPFLAASAAYLKKRQLDRLHGDREYARAHTASDRAGQRVSAATEALECREPKKLYSELHKAISGYITDKLGLPEAGLSDSELIKKVQERGADPQTVKSLKTLLDRCSTISYAPAGSAGDQQSDIDKTKQIIKELRKLF